LIIKEYSASWYISSPDYLTIKWRYERFYFPKITLLLTDYQPLGLFMPTK